MKNQAFSSDLRRYALSGAQARLAEITQELDVIRRAFPELGATGTRRTSSNRTDARQDGNGDGSAPARRRRRGRTMSAAQRKAVGERMKKYWASRRAAKAGTDGGQQPAASPQATKRRGPRTMSAEARKRISEAQKARWAKQRGTPATAASELAKASGKAPRRGTSKRSPRRAKRGARKVSAAARKRMSEAQKKQWAGRKRAGA
jgi:hypothetical protein